MSEIKVEDVKNMKDDTPHILANESTEQDIHATISGDCASDKMDELTSLEREIAQMHQPTAPVVVQRVDVETSGGVDDGNQGDKVLLEMQPASRNSTPGTQDDALSGIVAETTQTVESGDEDLIAVLKGFDRGSEEEEAEHTNKEQENHEPLDADLVEGVTIEGEGEFQIMEVVDDDGDELAATGASLTTDSKSKIRIETYKTITNKPYGNSATKMTREEERAMAMEQMAGLKARVERQRRRKQDMKPLQAKTSDLVNALNAEWSDEDTTTMDQTSNVSIVQKTSPASSPNASVVSSPPKQTNGKMKSSSNKSVVVNMEDTNSTIDNVTEQQPTVSVNQQSGFKRTRIIKRKIIWDPDAPETRISYSQLVRGNKTKGESAASNTTKSTTSNVTALTLGIKKEPTTKKARPNTPKEQTLQTVKSCADDMLSGSSTPNKRRSQTPIANGANNNAAKKKKNSEVERLMGDEGAVNMLNSLENERSKMEAEQEDDKPHKPLMRSRASTISERFIKRETPPAIVVKKEGTPVVVKNKRGPKQKPSSTWDYVYKQQASEDSMIIRRRSNSSYSSTASQHRLSLDAPINTPKPTANKSAITNKTPATITNNSSGEEGTHEIAVKTNSKSKTSSKQDIPDASDKKSSNVSGKTFEFAKPESKNNQKTNRRSKDGITVTNVSSASADGKKASNAGTTKARSATRSPGIMEEKLEKTSKSPTNVKDIAPVADVVIKKMAKVSQIIFTTQKAKLNYTFTAQLMDKLVEALDKLSSDTDCHAVVLTTNAPHFCQGIDFTELTVGTYEKRKTAATQLATAVKNYIKTLATFPKPLIAGVNGSNIGLGVTQLPLFDVVVASDKSSYETPYVRIGQVPEGYCVWNNLTKIRGTLKTKLFWLCEKINSSESALCGLVNKLAATIRVNDDALLVAKKIAAGSSESYRVMKKTTIENHLDAIVTSLDEEFDTIAKQWTSAECFDHFKKFLELGHF